MQDIFCYGLMGVSAYFGIKYVIQFVEHKLVFSPTQTSPKIQYDLTNLRTKLQNSIGSNIILDEVTIQDNLNNISAIWFYNPQTPKTILHVHGNAGNISTRLDFIEEFGSTSSILLFDYHGYGKSPNYPSSPSEKSIYQDTLTAYMWLITNKGIYPQNILVYGESLGCCPTAWLGARLKNSPIKPKAIVLHCGFSNIKNIAKDWASKYLTSFLYYKLDNIKQVALIADKIPILIAHSKKDEIIDFYHSDLLLKANQHATRFELSGTHCGSDNYTSEYITEINKLFI